MSSRKPRGVIAAGHELTASAGAEILREGGNAFDAALAALFASCVAEPVLASLGGGGFLLAHSNAGDSTLYDFFAHTPLGKIPEAESDFYPIVADFGTAQQEFHIGLGSIATPGVIKGLFQIHRNLCRLPLREIIQPACEAAKSGVTINAFQHYISEIVSPILKSSPQALALHQTSVKSEQLAACGDVVTHPAMADAFEALAYEGEELFYLGEMGRLLISACEQEGGYLRPQDLAAYQVVRRDPLRLGYHGTQLQTNPAPSVGGTLIAFTLALLEQHRLGGWKAGSHDHLFRVAKAQQLTQQLRQDRGVDRDLDADKAREILTEEYLQSYRDTLQNHPVCARGTTQISVADADGNFASMTLSNGEGSGYVIPGTGIMMNNMLGEEDINPHGFHRWPLDRRIASMMSPTLVFVPGGRAIVTGSGGSNRIRSAILQVLINLIDFNMPIEEAVEHSRIHYEGGLLNLEAGPDQGVIDKLAQEFDNHRVWPQKNLFFGGAHSVMRDRDGSLGGQGDSRRGGVCLSV
jgi:gamma-glutamyltranspeptidase/glutathione hydrolase